MTKIQVSIIIVNYKSWKHLKTCLQSLTFDIESGFSSEIIVVDNCSNDGKLEEFKKEFSKVSFVLNSGNNGFANGCNYGASKAKGEYLLFLNPDTIANAEAVRELREFAKQNLNTGIVSCLQKKKNGGYEKSDRKFPTLFTLFGFTRAIQKFFAKSVEQTEEDVLYTDWVSGSVVFMSKIWFDKIQGWNEDYWMYYEDMDLCKRVHLANGKVAILETTAIIHNHGGASRLNIKTAAITKTEVLISKHVYIQNHFKGLEKAVSQLLLILVNIIVRFLLGILGLLLFFIPKMRLNIYLLIRILSYYVSSLTSHSWLSKNSMNKPLKA